VVRLEWLSCLLFVLAAASFAQQQGAPKSEPPTQPIAFSHKTHSVSGLKCQDCHPNPDPGDHMTLPAAQRCMTCHATIAKNKPEIEKLAKFANSKEPIPWVRLYSVPAGVYWSHRAHLSAALQCDSCHGAIAQMDKTARVTKVTTMDGCIGCHREKGAGTGCGFCHEER
jgi:Class III cytochrome C family/Cytochrome c7 and related cytochrome c